MIMENYPESTMDLVNTSIKRWRRFSSTFRNVFIFCP